MESPAYILTSYSRSPISVGTLLGVFVLALLLYFLRRSSSEARGRCIPKFNINARSLRRRKSHGIKEMISVTERAQIFALQQEQQQFSSVKAHRPDTKSTRASIISDVDTLPGLNHQPEILQKGRADIPESSWLLLSPAISDEKVDIETAGRPVTARTSRVTIPSYYYRYYRKYFDRDNYRVQSQYYPEQRLSSGLISYRDRSSSVTQRQSTSKQYEGVSINSEPLVTDKNLYDRDTSGQNELIDQDPRLAYFEFDIHLPHKTNQAILPPPPAARGRRSMDTYRSSQQYHQSRRNQNRQTASSIATVSTAPIFRQHPGEEVDLGLVGRVGRIRSSVLSGLIVR